MFKGRIDRLGMLLGNVFLGAVLTLFVVIAGIINSTVGKGLRDTIVTSLVLIGLLIIAASYITVSFTVRRWHDLNYSGWFCLLSFIPYAGGLVTLWLLVARGTEGPNKYGNPQHPRDFDRIMFGPRPADKKK